MNPLNKIVFFTLMACINISAIDAQVISETVKMAPYMGNSHGLTFTKEQFIIANDQVAILLKDDYKKINKTDIKAGDVAIYYEKGQIKHSATLVLVENKLMAYSKVETSPNPVYTSIENAWKKADGIEYYSKIISDKYNPIYQDVILKTDKGNSIPAKKHMNANPEGKNYDANGHGLTFLDGQMVLDNKYVYLILKDEYKKIEREDLQPDDIAIYYEKSLIKHSAIIKVHERRLMAYTKIEPSTIPYLIRIDDAWPKTDNIKFYRKIPH